MKILSYSDLHLEFRHGWSLPPNLDGDILVLAGDTILFNDFAPLFRLLDKWRKPVLYVSGNHEYYSGDPMPELHQAFRNLLATELPQVHFLNTEHVSIDGVNFFGGTMWTDFESGDISAMQNATVGINDFKVINYEGTAFTPEDSVKLHQAFLTKLEAWLYKPISGPRVVITHHAPVIKPDSIHSEYTGKLLKPAFVAYDTLALIEKYAPDVWIHGHTHECDYQTIGKTKILSNQLGYKTRFGYYENEGTFDEYGCALTVV
jgi:predicted phosphodiesterase